MNGLILLRLQSHSYAGNLTFPVAFGFTRQTGHYWCKAVTYTAETNDIYDVQGGWKAEALHRVPREVRSEAAGTDAHSDIAVFGSSELAIQVDIKAGLCGDSVALMVCVDGLVRWS